MEFNLLLSYQRGLIYGEQLILNLYPIYFSLAQYLNTFPFTLWI